jgi:asparagine synthase (glutamine-hydrolysing)
MCGFAAMIRLDGGPIDADVLRRMASSIQHRGPDDSGEYVAECVGFAFRRLSILDLSPAGHQPMTTIDGRHTIVFNGEIYNFRELRRELEAAGHVFRSSGDTEVLLRAYVQWGAECLQRLNGMWAFVIHDRVRNLVFGSRDRFGIKPLFLWRDRQRLLAASELKAIRASQQHTSRINWTVAADFLLEGRLDAGVETFFEGIEHLPAAHAFELSIDGRYRQWRYWQLPDDAGRSGSESPTEFAELFEDAVRLHMRSDVPVGVHLSGGLDSTSIICAAARTRRAEGNMQALRAFSYIAEEYDESSYIRDTIEQTGASLTVLGNDPQRFWSMLKEVMWHQDEPFHSINLLVSYELMRLTASSGIKVILNGQGADETLAGYPSYFRDYWSSLLRRGSVGMAAREIDAYCNAHGGSTTARLVRQLRHFLQGSLSRLPAYRRLSTQRWQESLASDDWFAAPLAQHLAAHRPEPEPTDLHQSLARSMAEQPLPLYLRTEDRNSMAHSIEARVPFLDYRLVEFAFRLAPERLMRGPWNKLLLREAMRDRIPESVRTRVDKFGFPVPVRQWVSNALQEPARAIVTSAATRERGIYNVDNILRDLDRHRRGEIDVGQKIFNVLQFECWSQLDAPLASDSGRSVSAAEGLARA